MGLSKSKNFLFLLLFLVWISSSIFAESGVYDRFGIITEHGLHGAVPEENIDLFTGNLTLKNLDIRLPGPNGFDLNIWRVYNSKVIRDRFPGSAWGIQQEPYSWVGFGWSMHMGRLHYFNTQTPVVEFPDGRWETAYYNIDNSGYYITRDFLKLDKTNYILYFKDGTKWTFGETALLNFGGFNQEQVRVVTRIENPYGHHIDITYDGLGSPRMSQVTDSMGRNVYFYSDSQGKLTRIDVRNATGGTVSYSYIVDEFNGDYYKLTRFQPPEIPAVTYEYGDGMTSNWELLAVNTSYGGRMEYAYTEHTFYYQVYALQTKVMNTKRIKFTAGGSFSTWNYIYPSYQNVAYDTVEIDGPTFNSAFIYNAYSSSYPWKVGLVRSKQFTDGSSSEEYHWTNEIISNTHWIVLNIDMGQAAAPLQSQIIKNITGDADSTEEFLYERSGVKKYGMPTKINFYANGNKKFYKTLEYTFENNSSFQSAYMISYVYKEILYDSGNNKRKETQIGYFTNGAIDWINRWKESSTYLNWNYGYSSSNPNYITVTIDLPGSSGTETYIYRYGVLATLERPGYAEFSRSISSYDSSILSDINQHSGTFNFSYDNLGRITHIDMPAGFNDMDANWSTNSVTITQTGNTVIKYWDGIGRDTGHAEQGDGITLYYRKNLDSEGRIVTESKGSTNSNEVYAYELTAVGQVKKITDPRGKSTNITYSGDQKTVTDPDSHSTVFTFDHLPGLATGLTDPAGRTATYSYDGIGRLTQTIYNSGRTQSYSLNGMDQVTSESHPETGTISFVYNSEGTLTSKTWGGTTVSYSYNSSNQLTGENSGDEAISYTYDSNGRVSGISSDSDWSRTAITYNSLGSITHERQYTSGLVTKSVWYTYSGNNNLLSITYPDGKIADFTNNSLNMPETVMFFSRSLINSISYGTNKQPTSMNVVGNGTTYNASYNGVGAISTASLTRSITTLFGATYGYDNVGNIATISNSTPYLNVNLGYDNLNRLTSASYTPAGTGRVNNFSYQYDYYGNMTGVLENGGNVFSQLYDGQNRMNGCSYDSRGNLLSTAGYQYTWDHKNRLYEAKNTAGELLGSFAYNERGLRLKATRPVPPTLTITAPNGGESWTRRTTQNITWTSTNITSNIKLVLFKSGTKIGNIVQNIPVADGSYSWTVGQYEGGTAPADSGYVVRIVTMDGLYQDNSDNSFAILPNPLNLTSPNGSENWTKGTVHNITWTSSGVTTDVKLVLYKDGVKIGNIVQNLPISSGSYAWIVGDYEGGAASAGSGYIVRIRTMDGTYLDESDGSFSISSSPISISSPNGGENWVRGSVHNITWTYSGVSSNIKLVLMKDGVKVGNIIQDIPISSTPYAWTVGNYEGGVADVGSGYKIRIRTMDGVYLDESDGSFSIGSASGLNLIYPNGGEQLHPGTSQTIKWNGIESIRDVKLEYSTDNGSTYGTITEKTLNTGAYEWSVPQNISKHCLIRVSDANGRPQDNDTSFSCHFNFRVLKSADSDGSDPDLRVWFGRPGETEKSYRFAELSLFADSYAGNYLLDFVNNPVPLGDIQSFSGNWHHVEVQLNIMRDRGSIFIDGRPILQDIPLNSSVSHYFEPFVTLASGSPAWVNVDDFKVGRGKADPIVDSGRGMENRGSNQIALSTVVLETFELYPDETNLELGGWNVFTPVWSDSSGAGIMAVNENEEPPRSLPRIDKAEYVSQYRSLAMDGLENRPIIMSKRIDIPEREPFDVSDGNFAIMKEGMADEPEMVAEPGSISPLDEREIIQVTKTGTDGNPVKVITNAAQTSIGVQITANPKPVTTQTTSTTLASTRTTAYYIYSHDGKLLAEYDNVGSCVKDYIYVGNKLIAEYRPQTLKYYYYTSDQVNSTRIVTDDTGTVVHSASYDPYGGVQKTWVDTYKPALKFSGKEREYSSELDYFGARYYNHLKYRFLSVDPVITKLEAMANPQLWNLYAYCKNNPINVIDPNGAYGEDVHYHLTKYLALQAGFSESDAGSIAFFNQQIDDNPDTSATNFQSGSFNIQKKAWHFASDERVTEVVNKAFSTRSLSDLGAALHCLQDSLYAHREYRKNANHIVDSIVGQKPDNTSSNPEMALQMAQHTFDILNTYKGGSLKKINNLFLRKVFTTENIQTKINMLSK